MRNTRPLASNSLRSRCLAIATCVFLMIAAMMANAAPLESPEANLSPSRFHEGIELMWTTILEKHPDPFRYFPRRQFEERISRLQQRNTPIPEAEAFVEASKLIGMLGSGHSWISIDDDSDLFSEAVPLRFWKFSDGIRVRAASRDFGSLLGARVVSVGGVPVEEAWTQIREAVGGGEQIEGKRAQIYLVIPEFLHAIGLASDTGHIEFEFESLSGKRIHRRIAAEHYENYSAIWNTADKWAMPENWITPPDAGKAAWFSRRDEAFWYDFDADSHSLHATFNLATTDPDSPWNPQKDALRPFLDALFKRVEEADVQTLIIDLRNNNGGNSALWQPLVHHIIRSEKLYEPGKLYVITSRLTESAAVAWAAKIESNAPAIFVGEATASAPNFDNDPDGPRRKTFHFPGSAVNFRIASMMEIWSDSNDRRSSIHPDIPVEMTWSEFAEGRDPALRAIHGDSNPAHYFVDENGESLLSYPWANYQRISQREIEHRDPQDTEHP